MPTRDGDRVLFWRRKRDDDRPADPSVPEIDLEAPEPDPADFELAAAEPVGSMPVESSPEEFAVEEPPGPSRLSEPEPGPLPAPRPDALWGPGIGPPPVDVGPALDIGLAKTRGSLVTSLRGIIGADGETAWDDVEETLIAGDVGAVLAMDVVERARRRREAGGPETAVRNELAGLLVPREPGWSPQPSAPGAPAVILIVGVNGTGKTTTIGKLATRYSAEGRRVLLAAADTFRAAAIDQLRIWAERAGVPVVAHAPNADPGAVVFDALDAAVARGADLVIVDTAGRLHTKANLMEELSKMRRIVNKRLPGSVPETLFVLDATTGQNGLAQAKAFHESVGLTGIVLTKLDSTSKGGIVFAIEHGLGVPVRFVGVGEKATDLIPFDPDAFVSALFA
jgi:fused signal recognition particle receptor